MGWEELLTIVPTQEQMEENQSITAGGTAETSGSWSRTIQGTTSIELVPPR